jgi:hypothetical protein
MNIDLKSIFIPPLIALVSTSVLFTVRSVAFRLLHRWAERTEAKVDDIIIKAFKVPSLYWCIAIGLYIGIAISDLPERYVFYFSKAIHIIVIFSITIATANLSGKIFRNYVQKSELPIPTTGLAYGILKGTVFVIGHRDTIPAQDCLFKGGKRMKRVLILRNLQGRQEAHRFPWTGIKRQIIT